MFSSKLIGLKVRQTVKRKRYKIKGFLKDLHVCILRSIYRDLEYQQCDWCVNLARLPVTRCPLQIITMSNRRAFLIVIQIAWSCAQSFSTEEVKVIDNAVQALRDCKNIPGKKRPRKTKSRDREF